jgi:uncharacterized repeat protein (TIGR03803 family)
MSKLSLWKTICLVIVFCALEAISSPAQTFTTLVSFNGTDGLYATGSLVQGLDGNFYGTTRNGGANDYEICVVRGLSGCGTVFKITPGGTLTTLYSFCSKTNCIDGFNPQGGLVLATDGNFYGTTSGGGANGDGTVFKITPGGKLTTLHCFDGTDGAHPSAGLVQATDGNFYGTTYSGGAYGGIIGAYGGTVFKITPGGTLTTLYSFCSQTDCPDGAHPSAGLIQATDGNFYGTTLGGGGVWGFGTAFRITPGGKLTTLHSFGLYDPDGYYPSAGLVQATDGNFYGTTSGGGIPGTETQVVPDQGPGFGTVFKITPGGTVTTLFTFDLGDGASPSGLVQATDGNFYGTTYEGGFYFGGTVFKITPGGTLSTLHSFCSQTNCTDGSNPNAGLVLATDGNFYGTTTNAGANNDGTVFSLAVGLGPFVETLPTSGEVGAAVIILGTDLTGATSVTFDGAAAAFTVVSGSEITTTVPSGAATCEVRVTTPKGTLICNVKFRVTPTISSFSPTSGPVGTSVVVTGEGFRGATCISIGGVMATSFTVDSDTQITATVPTGAKTGQIAVSTLGGTAVSAGTFTVN